MDVCCTRRVCWPVADQIHLSLLLIAFGEQMPRAKKSSGKEKDEKVAAANADSVEENGAAAIGIDPSDSLAAQLLQLFVETTGASGAEASASGSGSGSGGAMDSKDSGRNSGHSDAGQHTLSSLCNQLPSELVDRCWTGGEWTDSDREHARTLLLSEPTLTTALPQLLTLVKAWIGMYCVVVWCGAMILCFWVDVRRRVMSCHLSTERERKEKNSAVGEARANFWYVARPSDLHRCRCSCSDLSGCCVVVLWC